MENIKPMDKPGFKKFLKLYSRYIYSIVNQSGEDVPDEIITDEELDFLYNLYQEIEFNKQITITK